MKSHVSLEQKICIVTAKPYETNSLLLDRSLKNSLEKETITGWGFSPEVQEKIDEGFVALVEIDYEKSTKEDGKITPEGAYRLGTIAYIKRDAFEKIFDRKDIKNMSWIDSYLIKFLQSKQHPEDAKKK